ncbi:MAG: pantetheine-phosphate adenylyltransferase [Pseudomonadota bacterium]|jgi:pantetheine-phosphate adenylyltransferase|nr:pantetheine-phosphate adenylyltransferase [Pseudomonadota bacterium]MEE3322842.1 pantetheine-phosphate adenylyltransferase [Pseudomonadota bacterium]
MAKKTKERIGIYAGSFDPLTLGHIAMIKEAAVLVDRLIISIGINPAKKGLFTIPERVDLINNEIQSGALKSIKGCKLEAKSYDCMTVKFAQQVGAAVMFRGLRSANDFNDELGLALTNKDQDASIKTAFLITDPTLTAVSSSMAKALIQNDGKVSTYLTPDIEKATRTKLTP